MGSCTRRFLSDPPAGGELCPEGQPVGALRSVSGATLREARRPPSAGSGSPAISGVGWTSLLSTQRVPGYPVVNSWRARSSNFCSQWSGSASDQTVLTRRGKSASRPLLHSGSSSPLQDLSERAVSLLVPALGEPTELALTNRNPLRALVFPQRGSLEKIQGPVCEVQAPPHLHPTMASLVQQLGMRNRLPPF